MEKKHTNKGYTLVEIIFYVALFAVMSVAVINAMLIMSRSFRERLITSDLTEGGNVMERMVREVRKANDITSISSTDLNLSTTDDSGNSKTLEFLQSGNNIQLLENGVLTGNLNSPNLYVVSLSLTQITSTNGKAVKISISVRSNNDQAGRAVDFNDTVALRGVY